MDSSTVEADGHKGRTVTLHGRDDALDAPVVCMGLYVQGEAVRLIIADVAVCDGILHGAGDKLRLCAVLGTDERVPGACVPCDAVQLVACLIASQLVGIA